MCVNNERGRTAALKIKTPHSYPEVQRYILDLIGRIVNVSIQTLDLMASLPPLSLKT